MWAGNLDIEWAVPFDMLFKNQFGRSLQIQGPYNSDQMFYVHVCNIGFQNLQLETPWFLLKL